MKELIRQKAVALGFDACFVTGADRPDHAQVFEQWLADGRNGEMQWLARNAHKRVDPQQVLPGARSIVCLAASYHREVAATGPVARYARFDDYHGVLASRLTELTAYIDAASDDASTRSLWYVDTGPLLERDLAQRAGLGFVGKHTNLIGRSLGNWFFLSEIITTLALEPDAPEKNRCGSCTKCLTACPTNALPAPFTLDARRCISYLTIELKGSIPVELRPLIGNHVYGCDDCLAVCPWNRFAREASIMKSVVRTDLDQPDLLELLTLDDAGFKKRFAGSPILRTKRRGLLRNVCVVLGNIGDGGALPALDKAAADPEPLIAEHAAWATTQIRRRLGQASDFS